MISSYQVIHSSFIDGTWEEWTSPAVTLKSPYDIASQPGYQIALFLTSVGHELCQFEKRTASQPLYATISAKVLSSTSSLATVLVVSSSSSQPSALSSSGSSSFSSSQTGLHLSLGDVEPTSHALMTKYRIIVGVSVSAVLTVSTAIAIVAWLRYRTRKLAAANTTVSNKDPVALNKDGQPYLQQKAELGDEDRRIHELDACGDENGVERRDKAYEKDGDDAIHEIDGDDAIHEIDEEGAIHEIDGEDAIHEISGKAVRKTRGGR
ncbi:MAG: hypothetical protein Q9167_006634 [Letrouitia subvulpina]